MSFFVCPSLLVFAVHLNSCTWSAVNGGSWYGMLCVAGNILICRRLWLIARSPCLESRATTRPPSAQIGRQMLHIFWNTLIVNNQVIINNYCVFQTISRSIVVSVTKGVIKRKKNIYKSHWTISCISWEIYFAKSKNKRLNWCLVCGTLLSMNQSELTLKNVLNYIISRTWL